MKKLKLFLKHRPFFACLLAGIALMVAFSGVQTSRAALTVVSDNYNAQLETDTGIQVTLLENKTALSDSTGQDGAKILLNAIAEKVKEESGRFHLGQNYEETLNVRNTGTIEEYVRIVIYKYWTDKNGKKITTLEPELIQIGIKGEDGSIALGGGDWIVDPDTSTRERTVLYYKTSLDVGEESVPFMDTLRISGDLIDRITRTETVKSENGKTYTTITASYPYEGMSFVLEVEADCVQTHNAAAAIRSAWGAKLTVDETTGSLSLQ